MKFRFPIPVLHKLFLKLAHIFAPRRKINESTAGWVQIQAGAAYGLWMYLNLSYKAYKEMHEGIYDEIMYCLIKELIPSPSNKVFWDVGAHFGYHSLAFSQLVGRDGKVIAFEPNPFNQTQLQKHLIRNQGVADNITVIPAALSKTNGKDILRYSNAEASSDIGYLETIGYPSDRVKASHYDNLQQIEITTKTIDSIVSEIGIIPDCIKIDVEGAECNVLEGGLKLLSHHKPVLFVEVHNISAMYGVQNLLWKFGYQTRFCDMGSSSKCLLAAFPLMDNDSSEV